MENRNIYEQIAQRTQGDIYIGVVGPVRTGKSTFIKRFMETLVLPNIESSARRERANDELPQSSAGRTIMTTEPKFIPEEAVRINIDASASLNIRMIDCVGYIVPSSLGYIENEQPRMVMTPWFDRQIPFNMAAEMGTRKVIAEHSTIGLVVTTDGSISDIPRAEYQEAEERVINELKEIEKPFIILLNCMYPRSDQATAMKVEMEQRYNVPVVAVNCLDLGESEIKEIMSLVLYQFPMKEIQVEIPRWIVSLGKDHWLKASLYKAIQEATFGINRILDLSPKIDTMAGCEHVRECMVKSIDFGTGSARIAVSVLGELFYKILGEVTGLPIQNETDLMPQIIELAKAKKEYDRIKNALDEVNATGYGIVMPTIEELTLEQPEMVRQGGRYGVRLRASAPSIHMMKACINTEVAPIVGSEKQSEELVTYMMSEFEDSPEKIWQSNIFGKSLNELVNEGLRGKLQRMPTDARMKLKETIERIINEGCSGLICIIL